MDALWQRLLESRPLAVMARCVTHGVLDGDLDDVFERHRERQYCRELLFSNLAKAVADVVFGLAKSPRQAYLTHRAELGVSSAAFYDKLNRVECRLSEALVSQAFDRTAAVLSHLGVAAPEPIAGYRAQVIDGNHLRKSEKRIRELRGLACATLPGTVVAVYGLQSGLFERAYLLEDAHAQESTVLDRLVTDLRDHDLVIADRHFCIVDFLRQIAAREAAFIIRQHGRLRGELLGKRRAVGRGASGMVYEQPVRLGERPDGSRFVVRRVTVELNEPTRDGETALHILTNIPSAAADGRTVADVYRQRWEIENAFYRLTTALTCEVKTLGHPRAAWFVFCLALVAANCARVLVAALAVAHGAPAAQELSAYSLARDIEHSADTVAALLTDDEWAARVPDEPAARAAFLVHVAGYVNLQRHRKSHRGPKKPPPKRSGYTHGRHVATAKVLAARDRVS